MSEIKVSFIIPHKGREDMLLATLRSIAEQDWPHQQLEVILVSHNQSISEEVEASLQGISFTGLSAVDTATISASRNLGAQQARGDYFAFLDADVKLSRNWVEAMLSALHAAPERVLVSAQQINSDGAPPLERIRTALSNAEVDCAVAFLPGRNLFLARKTFDQVQGFPEHLITCEDYYFTDQVAQLGELYYTSAATYVHIGEDKRYMDMYFKEIWRGQSNLDSLRGRKIPLREWPSFIVPFAICLLVLLSLPLFALDLAWLGLACLLLAGLPFSAYVVRLKSLVQQQASLFDVTKFYALYFPARAWGTLLGGFKSISTSSHR